MCLRNMRTATENGRSRRKINRLGKIQETLQVGGIVLVHVRVKMLS